MVSNVIHDPYRLRLPCVERLDPECRFTRLEAMIILSFIENNFLFMRILVRVAFQANISKLIKTVEHEMAIFSGLLSDRIFPVFFSFFFFFFLKDSVKAAFRGWND